MSPTEADTRHTAMKAEPPRGKNAKESTSAIKAMASGVVRDSMEWILLALCFGLIAWEIYLRLSGGSFSLEPLYWYLFVEHRAIAMPVIAVVMVVALLFDHQRAKRHRSSEPRLRTFWKVVAFFAIAFATYIAINGIRG